ncbi:MAG: hypothetical protein ABR528_11750 [Pseudonocardiaceae bacterium]
MAVDQTTTVVHEHRAFEAGLDALEAPALPALPPRPSRVKVFGQSVLPPVVAVAAFIALWQLAYSTALKPSYALPSPIDVFRTFGQTVRDGRAWEAI